MLKLDVKGNLLARSQPLQKKKTHLVVLLCNYDP